MGWKKHPYAKTGACHWNNNYLCPFDSLVKTLIDDSVQMKTFNKSLWSCHETPLHTIFINIKKIKNKPTKSVAFLCNSPQELDSESKTLAKICGMDFHHPSGVLCNDHADEDVGSCATYDISQVGKSRRFNLHFPKTVPHAKNVTGLKTTHLCIKG